MRRTVSLSEFMPYGAPDLLAARRPHLALALASVSMLAALLFLAAIQLVPAIRSPLPPIDWRNTIEPPPPVKAPHDFPPPLQHVAPARPRVPPDAGVIVPVPPAEAPPLSPPSGPISGDSPIKSGEPD